MHRAQPVANRTCSEKWTEQSYRKHRQRLQGTKPSVDNRTPSMYPHLYQKLKKAQMEEERCCEIERDNRTLVRRMTEIMQRSAIDTRNAVQYKSLNRNSRRRQLVRITQENQALLRRIQQSQPTYSHLVWQQQRDRSETLCQRICRYPYRPAHGSNREFSPMGMSEGQYYDEAGVPMGYPSTSSTRVAALPPVVSGQTAAVSAAMSPTEDEATTATTTTTTKVAAPKKDEQSSGSERKSPSVSQSSEGGGGGGGKEKEKEEETSGSSGSEEESRDED